MAATMSSGSSLGAHPAPEDQFVTSMLLLGFDREANEKRYGVILKNDMFHGCNVKGMEVVFYFLFTKINPEQTKDIFRVVWPITDKKQSRDFKTLANKFITDLEKAGHIPSGTMRLSHLHTCSGDRFYNLVYHLSTYAIKCVLQRSGVAVPYFPALDSNTMQHADAVKNAIRLKKNRLANEFVARSAAAAQEHEQWLRAATDLQKEYRDLIQRKTLLEREMKEFDALMAATQLQQGQKKYTEEELQRSAQRWEEYLTFLQDQKLKNAQMMEKVLEKNANAQRLDGKELRVDPSALERVTQILSSLRLEAPQPNVNGKLDLANLTKLWTASLSALQPKLAELSRAVPAVDPTSSKRNFPSQDDETGNTTAAVERLKRIEEQHQHHASAARKSAAVLTDVTIPEMKENIDKLQKSVDESVRRFASQSRAQQMAEVPQTPLGAGITPKKAWTRSEQKQRGSSKHSSMDLVPPTPAHGASKVRGSQSPPRTVSRGRVVAAPASSIVSSNVFSLLPTSFHVGAGADLVAPDQEMVAQMTSEIRAAVSSLSRSQLVRASPASTAARKRINQHHAINPATVASPVSMGGATKTKDSLAAFGLSPLQVDTFDVDDILKDMSVPQELPNKKKVVITPAVAAAAAKNPEPAKVDLSAYISSSKHSQVAHATAVAPQHKVVRPQSTAPTAVKPKVSTAAKTAPTTSAATSSRPASKRDNLPPKPWVLARQQRAAEAKAQREADHKPSGKNVAETAQVDSKKPQQRSQKDPDVEKAFRIVSESEPVLTPGVYSTVAMDSHEAFRTGRQLSRTPQSQARNTALKRANRLHDSNADDEDELRELEQTVSNMTVAPTDEDFEDNGFDRMLDELETDSVRDGSSKRFLATNPHSSTNLDDSSVLNEEEEDIEADAVEEELERSVAGKMKQVVSAFSRAAPLRRDSFTSGILPTDPELSVYEAELDRLDSPAPKQTSARFRTAAIQEEPQDDTEETTNDSADSSIELAKVDDTHIHESQIASPSTPSAVNWNSSKVLFAHEKTPEEVEPEESLLDTSFVMPTIEDKAEENAPVQEEEQDALEEDDVHIEEDAGEDLLNASVSIDAMITNSNKSHLSHAEDDIFGDDDDLLGSFHTSESRRASEHPGLDTDVADQEDDEANPQENHAAEEEHNPQLDMSLSFDFGVDAAGDENSISGLASPLVDVEKMIDAAMSGGNSNYVGRLNLSHNGLDETLSMPSPTLNRIAKHLAFSPQGSPAPQMPSFGSPL